MAWYVAAKKDESNTVSLLFGPCASEQAAQGRVREVERYVAEWSRVQTAFMVIRAWDCESDEPGSINRLLGLAPDAGGPIPVPSADLPGATPVPPSAKPKRRSRKKAKPFSFYPSLET